MHALIVISTIFALEAEPPKIAFANCNEHKAHVAIQPTKDGHVVHFHVILENAAGKTAFARLRCAEKVDADKAETAMKRFKVSGQKEEWSIYFQVPRQSGKTVHQIEIGFKGQTDPTIVDEYQVLDSFAWMFKNGEINTGTKDQPIGLETIVRRAVVKGGEFTIESSPVYRGASDIVCKKTTMIQGDIDGERALKRVFPR